MHHSLQDSTAETSNNQPETAGIEAAAMATGVLDSCSQKEGDVVECTKYEGVAERNPSFNVLIVF